MTICGCFYLSYPQLNIAFLKQGWPLQPHNNKNRFFIYCLWCQSWAFEGIGACLFVLFSIWLHSNVSNAKCTTGPVLCSHFRQPAWWLGPTLARASHTSPAWKPARHSELAAPPTASPMTSVACKTPGSGAEAERGREIKKRERHNMIMGKEEMTEL